MGGMASVIRVRINSVIELIDLIEVVVAGAFSNE